jgi:hypothetical protein
LQSSAVFAKDFILLKMSLQEQNKCAKYGTLLDTASVVQLNNILSADLQNSILGQHQFSCTLFNGFCILSRRQPDLLIAPTISISSRHPLRLW